MIDHADHLDEGNLGKIRQRLSDNGWQWTTLHLLARGMQRGGQFFESRARDIERKQDLPGLNSVKRNREVWGGYDWTNDGEEWTVSEAWRAAVVESFITPYLRDSATVLEIGPGAGRWSGVLQERSQRLILADITPTTLDLCRTRLGDPSNVDYLLVDGSSLTGVPDSTIDFLWSFDVFVHVAPVDQRSYAAEFARVLRPGAIGVIHHGGAGGLDGGWRSAMTADIFRANIESQGLRVLSQVERWGESGQHSPSVEGDVVSIVMA